MSIIFGVFYVRASGRVDDLRREFVRVEPAGAGWVACGFGDALSPDEAFGEDRHKPDVFASCKLSSRFGEAMFIYADTRADELLYDHSSEGKFIRKLMWTSDGSRSSWLCAAGNPEPWESEIFSEAQQARALDDAEPEDRESILQAYQARMIVKGALWPRCGASFADVIESHLGIIRPVRSRR